MTPAAALPRYPGHWAEIHTRPGRFFPPPRSTASGWTLGLPPPPKTKAAKSPPPEFAGPHSETSCKLLPLDHNARKYSLEYTDWPEAQLLRTWVCIRSE